MNGKLIIYLIKTFHTQILIIVAAAKLTENYAVENIIYQLRHSKSLNRVSVFSLTEMSCETPQLQHYDIFCIEVHVICFTWGYFSKTFSAQSLSAIIKQLERGCGGFIFYLLIEEQRNDSSKLSYQWSIKSRQT